MHTEKQRGGVGGAVTMVAAAVDRSREARRRRRGGQVLVGVGAAKVLEAGLWAGLYTGE